jgi:hypothetical protein
MSDHKNQHYLPQFYLEGFYNPDVPGLVYVRKKGSAYWMKRGVKNVGSQDYLYSFRDAGGNTRHEIETVLFQQLDDRFAPVLRKVLTEEDISNDEEFLLACFFMTTWQRVPGQVDHLKNIVSEIGQDILKVSYDYFSRNPNAWEQQKAQYKRVTGKNDIDILKAEDLNPAKLSVKATLPTTLLPMIESAISLSEIVLQMGWMFLKSEASNFFITSDSPCCVINPADKSRESGLAHQDVEISMPLSRHVAFFAGWENRGRRWIPASEHIVKQINYRTACFASRELITPKQVFPGSDKVLAHFS